MPRARFLWRHVPHGIFFLSCASIMIVELVASRLVARHLGSSLYTWSAVIAVMLAGITVGNLAGGRLADRRRPEAILPWLFLAAAVACAAVLGVNAVFAALRPWRAVGWPLRILLSVMAIFLLPATTLGMLSPALAKVAVERGRRLGGTLGSFYACGTLGSIIGTFLTGFWLIFALGNAGVMTATAVSLAALAAVSLLLRDDREEAPPAPRPAASVSAPNAASHDSGANPGLVGGASRAPAISGPLAWRYAPQALSFFAAVCLMIVELLASRIVADQAGTSLYTWTSVIGVVLAGMSLGNYVGGRLADRFAPGAFIGWLCLASSASAVAVLVLGHAFPVSTLFVGWRWPAVILATILLIFFVPSVLLGVFGPAAAKLAVQRATGVAGAVGSVSAFNAAGSIVGTLASGFWLIAALGTRSLTMTVAVLMGAAGLVAGPRRLVHAAWLVLVAAALVTTRVDLPVVSEWKHAGILRPWAGDLFEADSAYQHVRVYEAFSDDDPERELRVLALDYLIHGYVDPADPDHLDYAYERVYRDVALRYAGSRTRVSAFFLGGGSYTFPRWVMRHWPGSTAVVAEIDPVVVEANHQALGLPRDTPIRTVIGDARNVVDDLSEGQRFDFFFGDAFADLSVPYHLTTLEFTQSVARHLAPGGAYLVNVIDSYESGLFLGSFVNTLRRVFRHVYVFCTDPKGVVPTRDTFVVAASDAWLDTSGLEAGHTTDFDGSLLTDLNLEELERKVRGRLLTDNDAPVENLLAPVVRQRTVEGR